MKKELRRRLFAWIYAWLGLIDFIVCIITLTLLGVKLSERFLNWVYLREIKVELKRVLGEEVDLEFREVPDENSDVEGPIGEYAESSCTEVSDLPVEEEK